MTSEVDIERFALQLSGTGDAAGVPADVMPDLSKPDGERRVRCDALLARRRSP